MSVFFFYILIATCSTTLTLKSFGRKRMFNFVQYPDPKLNLTEEELKPIRHEELPDDFCFFEMDGNSTVSTNLALSCTPGKGSINYIMIVNLQGQVLWYKKNILDNASMLKRVNNSKNQKRYAYLIGNKHLSHGNRLSTLVIMNEYFQETEYVKGIKNGDVPENCPLTHEFIFRDDHHYVVLPIFQIGNFIEFAVQEIKDGKLLFHWQSTDHPELKQLSLHPGTRDYAHANAITMDKDGNFIVSTRHIGVFKISRSLKKIMWIISQKRNDFKCIKDEYLPKYQHDVRSNLDGSITFWDNRDARQAHSRVMRYFLDEREWKCTQIKEYEYPVGKSSSMGAAQILDYNKEIIGISFGDPQKNDMGDGWRYIEYDFINNKALFRFKFLDRGSFNVLR